MMALAICTRCLVEKPKTVEFFRYRTERQRLHSICRTCLSAYDASPERKNSRKASRKAWAQNNKHKINAAARAARERMRNKPLGRLISTMRRRLRGILKGRRLGDAFQVVGISQPGFVEYIRGRYKPGMTDENYGKYWHLDHIVPLSAWDLSNAEHVAAANHYSNVEPLEASLNLQKSGANRHPSGFYDEAVKKQLEYMAALRTPNRSFMN